MQTGTVVEFHENAGTVSEGVITRVWDKPAKDPYVTIVTTEDHGRTFVRCASAVWAAGSAR